MIHIFYVPGMHGTLIEHVLKSYTKEKHGSKVDILPDGSMHVLSKDFHFGSLNNLNNICLHADTITSPIYPMIDAHLRDIIRAYSIKFKTWNTDTKILVYAINDFWAEFNLLCQYHKIARGSVNRGLDIFIGNCTKNIRQWNHSYTSADQMCPWQFREYMSLFYPKWITEWVSAIKEIDNSWLAVTNKDIMLDTTKTMSDIITFCKLTPSGDLETFLKKYRSCQQYIVDDLSWAHQVVKSVVNSAQISWPKLSIISEAIVQHHLRKLGWEIQCDSLDILPTNTLQLTHLLYRPKDIFITHE